MRSNVWPRTLLTLALPLALVACGGEPAEDAAPVEQPTTQPTQTTTPATGGVEAAGDLPEGVTTAMVEEGQQLFSTICAACHTPAGTGTALAPDLTDDEWINISGRNFDEIVNVINTGVAQPVEYPAPMPPQGGGNYTDEQVRALAAFVYSISG